MEAINQTNRTILFEEINPEKYDLVTLIGDLGEVESINDEELMMIHQHLLVNSFDEFIQKFCPTIYSFYDVNYQKVVYTLKRPEGIDPLFVSETILSKEQEFLSMLLNLLEAERLQKKTQIDFRLDRVLELLSPRVQMEEIKKLRKSLRAAYGKYVEAEKDSPQAFIAYKAFKKVLEKCSSHYSEIMAILPLAIEDIKERLTGQKEEKKIEHNEIVAGIISQKITGELSVLEAPTDEIFSKLTLEDRVNYALMQEVRKDFQSKCGSNDYLEHLALRSFCPSIWTNGEVEDIEQEVENYNAYLDFYKKAKNDFIRIARPLLEKILGVKVFFDQYQGKEGMKPALIITNINNTQLTQHGNIDRLRLYLKTVNTKNDFNDCIWFGIIPSVEFDSKDHLKLTRERFKGNDEKQYIYTNSLESTMSLLNVVKDYKIQTFISFELKDKNSFNNMNQEGISKYLEYCHIFERKAFSEYTIVCLPNFTIIPKEKSGVFINRRMYLTDEDKAYLSEDPKDKVCIWIDGFYIGAAYVAAGVTAAYQCPHYLMEQLGLKKVDEEVPGVHIDVEQLDRAVQTTLAKEMTGFTDEVIDQLQYTRFGFVFASENHFKKDKKLPHAVIWQTRCMKQEDGIYEPIFKTLTCNYIERILKYYTIDFKEDSIEYFFSNHPDSQKSKWMYRQQYINAIVSRKDELNYSLDEENGYCTVKVNFAGQDKQFEVKVNRQEKMKKR